MATYKVLYWQEIPTQIVAEDDDNEVSLPLADKFMERVEAAAMSRGLTGADDYLAQWKWGEAEERDGAADEVAQAVRAELEAMTDW
jgi:hypothetical protein